jgi:aryl-alcohol dehydrogenase-like predicted oxidoreductase
MTVGILSRIGIGLAAVGRPAYINLGRRRALPKRTARAMKEATWRVLDEAYSSGIRHIDVAASYGRAEEFLSDWLTESEHEDVTVSSKWGYTYVGRWRMDAPVHEVKDHSIERFREQYFASMAYFGDFLKLFQVHSLTEDSPLLLDRALQETLAAVGEHEFAVGFSTSGPRQAETIKRALDLEAGGRRVFSSVQATWNLLEPSCGPALAEAHADGVRVIVKETMANGRLVCIPPPRVAELAKDLGVEADAIAFAAVLGQPWADTALLGSASAHQVRSNMLATSFGLEDVDLTDLAEPPEEYWAHRAKLAWR